MSWAANMTCGYLELVEEELNDICMWASIQKQNPIITVDLNMNRLKPECKEGNILQDLEELSAWFSMYDYGSNEDYDNIRNVSWYYIDEQTSNV